MGVDYHTHNLEGYVEPRTSGNTFKASSHEMDCRGPAILFSTQAPDDPRERINITSRSFSIQAFQLKEHEALA